MNVEIGTEAAQFSEKEYINEIFAAVCSHVAILHLISSWTRGGGEGDGRGEGEGEGEGGGGGGKVLTGINYPMCTGLENIHTPIQH